HCPSAANNNYWPELYSNMSIVDPKKPIPFDDTPDPKRFGTVSPLDPQLFYGIDECADAALSGKLAAKYSPYWVAAELESLAAQTEDQASAAQSKATDAQAPAFRRFAVDAAMQAGLGRFFAAKLRAGVLFTLFLRTNDPEPLNRALSSYRDARSHW